MHYIPKLSKMSYYDPLPADEPSVSFRCIDTALATEIDPDETYTKDNEKDIHSKIIGSKIALTHRKNKHEKDIAEGKHHKVQAADKDGEKRRSQPALKIEREGNIHDALYNACLAGHLDIVTDILHKHYTTLMPDEHGQTPLFAACIGDQGDIVTYLVQCGYDVNHQDNEGKTPLHVAFECGNTKIARLLYKNFDACVKLRDAQNWTPFHAAVDRGYHSASKVLLKEFFSQDIIDCEVSWIQLHAACFENNMQKVQILVENNADVNHVSSIGYTALLIACKHKNMGMVKYLLEHGAGQTINNVSVEGFSSLTVACAMGSVDLTEILLDNGADPNIRAARNRTAYHAAVISNNSAVLQYLLARSSARTVDVNNMDTQGETCLHHAVHERNLEIVTVLLEAEADPNCLNHRCFTPLHLAIHRDEKIIVQALLAHKANPNIGDADGDACLQLAIIKRRETMVPMLLDAGANIHATDNDGDTILHLAVYKDCSKQTLQILIDRGVALDAVNNQRTETPLLLACSKAQAQSVGVLLDAGANPNICDKDDESCLHWAVNKGCDDEVLQELIDHGAHLDALDLKCRTPLRLAFSRRSLSTMKVLMKAGADPNIPDQDGDTTLHNAIHTRDSIKTFQALIDHGANIDAVNNASMTPLVLASLDKQMDTIKFLLHAGADSSIPDKDGDTILHLGIHKRWSKEKLQVLVDHGAHLNGINKKGHTPLVLACIDRQIDTLQLLLNAGADSSIPDADGDTVAHYAIYKDWSKESLQALVDCGICLNCVNKKGQTALVLACCDRQTDSVKVLLEAGADPNIADADGDNALHNAIYKKCSKEIVQVLADCVTHIDALNNEQQSALMIACGKENIDAVQVLLSARADPHLVDKAKNNCLHIAVNKGNLQIVHAILSGHIDVNAQNNQQYTALFVACAKNNTRIAKYLIQKGADVNITNERNSSPLHVAIARNALDLCDDLLKHGANINLKGKDAMSPLHTAVRQGSDDAVQLLLQHGPDVNAEDRVQDTPLHVACRKGDNSKAIILLQNGAETKCKNLEGCTPFYYAVTECNRATVEAFVNHDPAVLNVEIYSGGTVLQYYCSKGNSNMVKWLVDHGADMDKICAEGNALVAALDNGHKNIVFMLIEAGADVSRSPVSSHLGFVDRIYQQRHLHMNLLEHLICSEKCSISLTAVNENHETFFFQACKDEAMEVVQMLLDCKHDIGMNICNKFGKHPVSILCEGVAKPESESIALLSMLLQSGRYVDVNISDLEHRTPLHMACQMGSLMMANMLLQTSKSSVNTEDAMGRTPLHFANTADLVKLLIRFGADVNKCDHLGQTPLLFHCQQGNSEAASTLITSLRGNISSCDHMGRTVAHLCTASKTMDILLKHITDIDINTTDINGQTPLHIAVWNGDPAGTELLLEHVADPNVRDKNNLCPVHLAADTSCWELLIDHMADTAVKSVCGYSAEDMKHWHEEVKSMEHKEVWHDIIHEGHHALENIMQMPYIGFIETNKHHQEESTCIHDELKSFMVRLSEEVQKVDPLLEFDAVFSGSVNEGTQVGMPDTADFICILPQISEMLQPPQYPTFSKLNITLNMKPDLDRDRLAFVDCNGCVNAQLLSRKFHGALQQALSVPAIWSEFSRFYRLPATSDSTSDISKVKLIWHGNVFKWVSISVNILPGIVFPDWQPSWCEARMVLKDSQCCIVARDIVHAPESQRPYLFQLSFFDSEAEMFRQMAPQLKAGFKLAKLMREPSICHSLVHKGLQMDPASTFLSSYMLKTVTFYLHDENQEDPNKSHVTDDTLPAIVFAQRIYAHLEDVLKRNFLGMYTIPEYNILSDHFRNLPNSLEMAQAYCSNIRNLLKENPKK